MRRLTLISSLLVLLLAMACGSSPAPISLTAPAAPDGYVGDAYALALQVAGGEAPYQFAVQSGALPAGLTLDAATGQISGTPTAPGFASVVVGVTDDGGTVQTARVELQVWSALALEPGSLPAGTVGAPYNQVVHASGGKGPLSVVLTSGSPGAGLSYADERLSGTPTQAGTASFQLTVTDANGHTLAQDFALEIQAGVAIATSGLPDGYVGSAYAQPLSATGGVAPLTWSLTQGALPAGLSLGADGMLQGTITAAGDASFTVKVTDDAGHSASQAFSIAVYRMPTLDTAAMDDAFLGASYSEPLDASKGKPPLKITLVSGTLPAGLTFNGAVIEGTPTTAGTRSLTFKVEDANARSSQRSYTLTVLDTLTVLTSSLGEGYVGSAYSATLSAGGGTQPITWSVIGGALPAGITLSSGGALSGTPSAEGTASFTVQAKDADGTTASKGLSIRTYSPPSVTTGALADGYQGRSYSEALSASGGKTPLTWSVIGTLPAGLSLSGASLTGTPTGTGTSGFSVKVTDANGKSATRALSIAVYAPPKVTTTTLPNGTEGVSYSEALQATGGKGTRTFSLVSGGLPPGLTLSSAGAVSGTPTAAGSYQFAVRVKDQNLVSTDATVTLVVASTTPVVLKVASWNVEWFGDPSNGPSDDALQEQNASDVIGRADLDLWGLAELVDQTEFDQLLSDLPGYSGFMANAASVTDGSSYYSLSEQKVGIVYKSDRFTVTGAKVITACDFSFAGRPPMEVSLTFSLNGVTQAFKLIVLHAKAFDTQAAYEKREAGEACLKSYLDGYPSDEILVVGDWNDDVDVSITSTSNDPSCTPAVSDSFYCQTPYLPLVADSADYTFLTATLSANGEHSTTSYSDMIDHHLGTNEMAALHVAGSTQVLRPDLWSPAIASYGSTTSDHYPVESDFNLGGSVPPAPTSSVILNEVLYTQVGTDYGSEFVELLNTGSTSVDLSGWTLSDKDAVRHTFASGTSLAAGKAIVVFGDATHASGISNAVGSSTGDLRLLSSDSITLRDGSAQLVDSHAWTSDFTTQGMSANRATDGDGSAAFVEHDWVAPGVNASPGTHAYGAAF